MYRQYWESEIIGLYFCGKSRKDIFKHTNINIIFGRNMDEKQTDEYLYKKKN